MTNTIGHHRATFVIILICLTCKSLLLIFVCTLSSLRSSFSSTPATTSLLLTTFYLGISDHQRVGFFLFACCGTLNQRHHQSNIVKPSSSSFFIFLWKYLNFWCAFYFLCEKIRSFFIYHVRLSGKIQVLYPRYVETLSF